jgi:hypothetical protein
MANIVQMGVDQFWAQLQKLQNVLTAVDANLKADKAQLTHLYAIARTEAEPQGSKDRALLQPLIHRNSELRLSYLKPARDKFNAAVSGAAAALKAAGFTPPALTGLGFGPALVIIPVIAVAAVLAGLELANIVSNMTAAQRARTATVAAIIGDHSITPEQKLALLKAQKDQTDAEKKANPPLFDFGSLALPLGIVAAIVLGPQILRMVQGRRTA